jgi:hypothetical protein
MRASLSGPRQSIGKWATGGSMIAMSNPRRGKALAWFWVVLAVICAWGCGRSAATAPAAAPTLSLRVDTTRPGSQLAHGAVGLSVDANELGGDHLSATHGSLVRLMQLLGPSVLRIGGGSVDTSWWTSTGEAAPPWATHTVTPADLVALRKLLRATGWRVLLGVDLGHFEPSRAADEARVAQAILGSELLLGIEVGNEPNGFSDPNRKPVVLRPPTYGVEEYLHEVQSYREALQAAAPGVAVYGPALSQPRWLTKLGASASAFDVISQHYYPVGACAGASSPTPLSQTTTEQLLSPATRVQEEELLTTLAQVGSLAGRRTRIGETGTGACGGNSPASAVFASALWSLDWALRAASSGVEGLNFHGHLGVCGPNTQSPVCAPSASASTSGEVAPQPEYYGLLAASRLEGGRFVPTSLTVSPAPPNLSTWATLTPRGTVKIAIVNLATGGAAQSVKLPERYTATEELLAAPSPEARSGIALAGARVTARSGWLPRPKRIRRAGRSAGVVVVRPATAVIVTLRPRH